MDKLFEKKYSIDVPKLRQGVNEDSFVVDRSFFSEFEHTPIHEGNVKVQVTIDKSSTHLDARFEFKGQIMLACDRCLEPYPYDLDFENRIVYTFDEDLEFDTDEVVLIDESTPTIFLAQDFYDFIVLEMPLRCVPEPEVHLCAPSVLEMLGLKPDGSPMDPAPVDETEQEVDPRWQALKKLKDSNDIK